MPSWLSTLLGSRKFWLSVVGVVQTILFSAIPDFPQEVWVAIDALLIVLIGTIAGEDMATKFGGRNPGE